MVAILAEKNRNAVARKCAGMVVWDLACKCGVFLCHESGGISE